MQALASIAVIGITIAAAFFYLKRSEASRAQRDLERKAQETRDRIAAGGSEVGSLWDPADPDPLVRKLLDDGVAHNSKWVDEDFVRIYRRIIDSGGGMDDALIAAMTERKWRRGSRGQVVERMASHLQGFSESDRERYNRLWEQQGIPEGFGIFS